MDNLSHPPACIHPLLFHTLLWTCYSKPWQGSVVKMLYCPEESAICFPYTQQSCSTAMLRYFEARKCFIVAALYTLRFGQAQACTVRQLQSAVVTAFSLFLRYSLSFQWSSEINSSMHYKKLSKYPFGAFSLHIIFGLGIFLCEALMKLKGR